MCYYINSLYVVLCLLDISVVCVGYITCMSYIYTRNIQDIHETYKIYTKHTRYTNRHTCNVSTYTCVCASMRITFMLFCHVRHVKKCCWKSYFDRFSVGNTECVFYMLGWSSFVQHISMFYMVENKTSCERLIFVFYVATWSIVGQIE
jgi:hypothetical protein